ncbi:hypothetical protein Tco_1435898 [Tanacetum coccineum]
MLMFIKSCVIWERVHNFQLGIKSYQIKINLTAQTLTFPSIQACNPYSIVDEPAVGLIYLNKKEEKRVMDLVDIAKFYDATLEKVLSKVKLKIFETEFIKKAPLLSSTVRRRTIKTHSQHSIENEGYINYSPTKESDSKICTKA